MYLWLLNYCLAFVWNCDTRAWRAMGKGIRRNDSGCRSRFSCAWTRAMRTTFCEITPSSGIMKPRNRLKTRKHVPHTSQISIIEAIDRHTTITTTPKMSEQNRS